MDTNNNFIVIKSDDMTIYCSQSKNGYLSVHAIDENVKKEVKAHADAFLSEYKDKLVELKAQSELTLKTYSALFASSLLRKSGPRCVIIELSTYSVHVQCLECDPITNPMFDAALIGAVEIPPKSLINSMIGDNIFTVSSLIRERLTTTDALNAISQWINTGYDQCVKAFSPQLGPVLY